MAPNLSRRALWMHKLAEEVARGLTARIDAGEIAPGAVLADRDTLAGEFVTSAGVVDRALELMETGGVLMRTSDGSYRVAAEKPPERGFELPSDFGETRSDVVSILELRMGVELISAALAAQRRDAGDLDRMHAAMAAFRQAAAGKEGLPQADFQLHRAIAAASRNPYIVDLLEYLGPLLIPRMRIAVPRPPKAVDDSNVAASLAEHETILAAIEAGDPDAARVAMRAHLTRTIEMIRALPEP